MKNMEESLSEILNKNQGIIAMVGIIIAFWIYFADKKSNEGYVDESLHYTFCLNLRVSESLIQGIDQPWRYIIRYQTKIYFDHIPSLLNNFSDPTKKGLALSLINDMDAINKELDAIVILEPFTVNQSIKNNSAVDGAKKIKETLKELGYSNPDEC